MAEAGIKISQLTDLTTTDSNDYTVVVHDGITYKASLGAIRGSFDSETESDHEAVERLINDVRDLMVSVDALSGSYDGLPEHFLSSSWSGMLEDIQKALYGEGGDFTDGVIDKLNELERIVGEVSSSVAPLTGEGFADTLKKLLDILQDDTGEVSLAGMADTIDDNTQRIGNLEDALRPTIDSSAKQEKQQEAILMDSVDSYDYTMQNNIWSADAINPINIVFPLDEDGDTTIENYYDFYYDRNRFANIGVPMMDFYISGDVYSDDPNQDPTQVFAYLHQFSMPGDSYLSTDESSEEETLIQNVSVISAYGLSLDEDYDIVTMEKPANEPWRAPIKAIYPGESTFQSDYGIPLRYGMLYPETLEDSTIDGSLTLSATVKSKIQLYLNRSPYITTQNARSKLSVFVDGELLGTKSSNKNTSVAADAIEGDGDVNLYYTLETKPGTLISFKQSAADLASVTLSSTIFGMLVPMTRQSQIQEIELDEYAVSSYTDDDNLTKYSVYGNVYFGIEGQMIQMSAFLVEDTNRFSPDDPSTWTSTPITTAIPVEGTANSYMFTDLNPNGARYVYIFAKDPRRETLIECPNNGNLYIGEDTGTTPDEGDESIEAVGEGSESEEGGEEDTSTPDEENNDEG